jgi:hypothetical protein
VKHPEAGAANVAIDGGRAHSTGGGTFYYNDAVPADAEYDVEGRITQVADAASAGVLARFDPLAETGYRASYRATSANAWTISKWVDGASATLCTWNESLSNGAVRDFRFEVRDGSQKLCVEDVLRCSSTDTTIAGAGRVGVRFGDTSSATTGVHLDSITATD